MGAAFRAAPRFFEFAAPAWVTASSGTRSERVLSLRAVPENFSRSFAIASAAYAQALAVLPLLRRGETVSSLRELIGNRPQVRLAFDTIIYRKRLSSEVGPALRSEILRSLRSGLSQKAVAFRMKIPEDVVRKIAQAARVSNFKRGRGRRFSEEERAQIIEAVRSGARATELIARFGISRETVKEFRWRLGDRADRRHRRKLTDEQIARAEELLRSGMRWRDVAPAIGCCLTTLVRTVPFRKGRRRIFSDSERAGITADIRAGLRQYQIAQKFRTHLRQIFRFQCEVGMRPHYRRFTPREQRTIDNGFRNGRTNAEIARTLSCPPSTIWARRKRSRER